MANIKIVAIYSIEKAGKTAGKVEIIAPGTLFSIDETEGDKLVALKAARLPTKDELLLEQARLNATRPAATASTGKGKSKTEAQAADATATEGTSGTTEDGI